MDSDSLRQRLADLTIPELRYHDTIGSTNDEAMVWAETGAPDFALVVADQQSRGRGRLGRHWVTHPGAALAFSLILQPQPNEMSYLSQFSPLGALGVTGALEQWGLAAQIKWPNDVLARRKKLCGILAETVWNGGQLRGLVLGIGVNVAPESVPPPEAVMFPATCVEWETGQRVDRWELLHAVLAHLQAWRRQLGQPAFLEAWQERLAFRGEPVEIHPPGGASIHGRLLGVDATGNLQLQLADGKETSVTAGDVHLRPETGE